MENNFYTHYMDVFCMTFFTVLCLAMLVILNLISLKYLCESQKYIDFLCSVF